MRSVNSFPVARYIVFGLFTICNAIICSVAAWNFGLVRSTKSSQVDIYLISLGAFSLFSVSILTLVELLCASPFTTRVWFECAWVTLFWIMELAGGAALIAIESELSCSHNIATVQAICASERVVLAFTWICTITLLIYLVVLVFIAASQHHEDLSIWGSDVRTLRASAARHYSPTAPHSPSVPRMQKRASVDKYAPHPVRFQPAQIPHHYKGISPEYKIEPFRPMFVVPEQMDLRHSTNLPEAIPLPPLAAAPTIPSSTHPAPALPSDAMHMRSLLLGLSDVPRELPSSISYQGTSLPSAPVPRQSNSLPLPSPPPLGDWPRQDAMKQPAKPKPRSLPSAFDFPKGHTAGMASTDRPLDNATQPRPRRPSGPRMRESSGESGHRPPQLGLYGIGGYESGCPDDVKAVAR